MTAIAYHLTRSKRRSMAIHLRDGRVEVRAPLFVSQGQIDAFVQSRQRWIAEHLQRSVVPDYWQDGLRLSVNEQPWQLRWRERAGKVSLDVDSQAQVLWLQAPRWSGAQAQRQLLNWLSVQAREQLLPALQQQAESMGDAARLQGVVFRYTKSMWGRCSAKGEILLNPAILLTPKYCIRYLLVHELAHLRHLNHSAEFWQRVETYCPDWRQARATLRQQNLAWLQRVPSQ